MTDEPARHGDRSPATLSPTSVLPSELPLRIPKNKSTTSLLSPLTASASPAEGRTRFSFDSGSATDINSLKRTSTRTDHDNGMGVSGLRRIRRPGPPSRTSTLILDEPDLSPSMLQHSQALPVSGPPSRAGSRSTSAAFLTTGPVSPVLEDLHRFPSESLHSYSFARQTEDFLHSRQAILQKSVDFLRDKPGWAANPGLANAQARVSGDFEVQGMMDLLRRAKIMPSLDIEAANSKGLGLGPLTGPADFNGPNVFEKSFSNDLETVQSSPCSSIDEEVGKRKASLASLHEQSAADTPQIEEPELPAQPRKFGLKRTYTDVHSMSLQQKLIEALAQPYSSEDAPPMQGSALSSYVPTTTTSVGMGGSSLHSHSSKWTPPAQAVFRTTADAPWTILAANDLACLTFGVTRAEVRSLSILGVIQEDRRQWLEDRLCEPEPKAETPKSSTANAIANGSSGLLGAKGGGITARLLSKAPSRTQPPQRAQTDGAGGNTRPVTKNHPPTRSRGVLLCGDIIPIRKRDGTPGAASFWVMEKRGGLIWVVEEITEDLAFLRFDDQYQLVEVRGSADTVWGNPLEAGAPLKSLIPKFPPAALSDPEYDGAPLIDYFTASTIGGVNVPISVGKGQGKNELRISSLPHIAGVMVIEPDTLKITSSNSVFSAALFGYDKPNGLLISDLIPSFSEILAILTEADDQELVEGLVVPEHSFRRARAVLALRDGTEQAASIFLRPAGLIAKHRDGSDLMVDVQMRVVRSETIFPVPEDVIVEERDEGLGGSQLAVNELVYAIWVTYSRQLHSAGFGVERPEHPLDSRPVTPPSQPLPALPSPPPTADGIKTFTPTIDSISSPAIEAPSPVEPLEHPPPNVPYVPHEKKTINDFVILEEMGKGAYGEVKLARYKKSRSSKIVLKYVVKKRILVDTWTRDRRLGTVPLEIHVLDFLRQPSMQHPNIVEMIDFFEDDVNYYIEMLPHGLPGMDLFDYIELRSNMEEAECRGIFQQVVDAIHHLHVKARVVHRDVKDENVVLDGEGRIKLIDFGSAAYIKNGPFDVFVGTLDYAAPEVLQGRSYAGPEQDVWALGILLYTLLFRENPFYNIDEILDHPLRVPFIPFSELCLDLVRRMLDREVSQRLTIEQVMNHGWLTSS